MKIGDIVYSEVDFELVKLLEPIDPSPEARTFCGVPLDMQWWLVEGQESGEMYLAPNGSLTPQI